MRRSAFSPGSLLCIVALHLVAVVTVWGQEPVPAPPAAAPAPEATLEERIIRLEERLAAIDGKPVDQTLTIEGRVGSLELRVAALEAARAPSAPAMASAVTTPAPAPAATVAPAAPQATERDLLSDIDLGNPEAQRLLIAYGGRCGLASNMVGIVRRMVEDSAAFAGKTYNIEGKQVPPAEMIRNADAALARLLDRGKFDGWKMGPEFTRAGLSALTIVFKNGGLYSEAENPDLRTFRAYLREKDKGTGAFALQLDIGEQVNAYIQQCFYLAAVILAQENKSSHNLARLYLRSCGLKDE